MFGTAALWRALAAHTEARVASTAEQSLARTTLTVEPLARSRTRHLPALDGLRAISVLLVMISHAGLGHVVPGGLGVTVFFFISGFLITRLLLEEHDANGRISFRRFYARRFLRLGPALVVYVLLASLAIVAVGGAFWMQDIAAALFYYANYHQIFTGFQHAVALAPDGGAVRLQSPFSILWSLAIEEHFYFLFPLTLASLAPSLKRGMWLFVALLVVILAWRLFLAHAGATHDRIYMGTDTRIDSILFGVVAAVTGRLMRPERARRTRLIWLACVIGVALMLVSLLARDPAFRETWRYSLQGLALTALVPALVFAPALAAPRRMLEHDFIVYVGKLSYSLYLYQYLVVMLATWFCALNALPQYGWTWIAIFVALTPLLAMASYHGVEQPFLRWRRRLGSSA
ncbi:MAG TPA: acyltransferase [Caulobacterales bacterium]|nr:acyltransferase [Caulobacterales bacterium]